MSNVASVSIATGKCILGYYIQSRMNGFMLDLDGGRTSAGTLIIVSPMKNGTGEDQSSQLWFFDQDGTIRNKAADMVLDISGSIDGTDLII
ncbi:unnamed protein product [Rotaria sp. Silwood2]|nr:unnamed protein product [Rotaria sp. Silwood2]